MSTENVRKNEELQMQNFCYCSYRDKEHDQIVVPLMFVDDCDLYRGDIIFERNFKSDYKVDCIVIEEDGYLHNILIVDDKTARLRHIPNDYDEQNLRNVISIATGSFDNPIRISMTVSMIGKKILPSAVLKSNHNIKLIETRLSEIKKG